MFESIPEKINKIVELKWSEIGPLNISDPQFPQEFSPNLHYT